MKLLQKIITFYKKRRTDLDKEYIKSLNLSKDSVIIDIGSELGQEIDYFHGRVKEIHTFEPHPKLFFNLYKKYRKYKNVFLIQAAAWKEECVIPLFLKPNNYASSGSSLCPFKESLIADGKNVVDANGLNILFTPGSLSAQVKNIPSEKVMAIDIAKYISDLNKDIDFLKIDAEGVEYQILEHIFNTKVYKRIKTIYYEDHSHKITQRFICNKEGRYLYDQNGKNVLSPEAREWIYERDRVMKIYKLNGFKKTQMKNNSTHFSLKRIDNPITNEKA